MFLSKCRQRNSYRSRLILFEANYHYWNSLQPASRHWLLQAAAAVANHARALAALLDVAGDDAAAAQETPFGALRPPLGLARLKVRGISIRALGHGFEVPCTYIGIRWRAAAASSASHASSMTWCKAATASEPDACAATACARSAVHKTHCFSLKECW